MLRVLLLSALVLLCQGAVLAPNPYVPLPIDLSVTNVNTVGTYWFNFQTSVQLDAGTYLYIKFPAEFETVTNTACKIVLNYKQPTASYASCTSSVSYPLIQVTFLSTLAANTLFSVQLDGVKNPQFLSTTGPFQVWTKTGKDSQYTSLNKMFGTLAFTALLPTPSSLSAYLNTTATGFSSVVSATSTYTFHVKWDYWIDAGAWFRIVLPTGWSKATGSDSTCTVRNFTAAQTPPSGTFFCDTSEQNVYVKGLTSSIDPSDITRCEFAIVVPGIVNPSSAQSEASAQFSIDLMDLGTTNILQKLQAFSPAIVPGALTSVQVTKLSYQAKDINGNSLTMLFSFTLSHSVPQDGSITLYLPLSTFVLLQPNYIGCAIISGITDKAAANFATCTCTLSSLVTVANFALIPASKTVVIQAIVSVAATDSEILTITTLDTAGKAIDTASVVLTRVYPEVRFAQSLDVTLGGVVGTVSSSGSGYVTFMLAPTMQVDIGAQVLLTFPPGFSVASQVCEQTAAGGSLQTLSSCNYASGYRAITLVVAVEALPLSSATSLIKIKGVNYPTVRSNYENVYEFCATTYVKDTGTPYNHGCVQKVLSSISDASLTFKGNSDAIYQYQPYTLTFKSSIAITSSATVTPQVRISLPTSDGSPLWDTNLGTSGTVFCTVGTSSSGVSCSVTAAASQAVGVPATFILSLAMNVQASTTYTMRTVLRSPQTASKTATHTIEVGYLENRLWKVIATNIADSVTTMAAAPAGFTVKTLTAATITTVQTTNPIVLSLQPPAAAGAWMLGVLFPVGWDVSTTSSFVIGAVACPSLESFPNSYAPVVLCSQGSSAQANPLPTGSSTTITISGIKNPAYTNYGISTLSAFYIDGSTLKNYEGVGTLTATTEAKITTASVTPDIAEMSAKGVHYTFAFTTVNAIPAGGIVTLTFPAQYNGFLTNYECQFGSGFAGNNNVALSCSISSQTVTISALAATKAGTAMSVVIRRVNNPSLSAVAGFYITTAQSAGFNIDRTAALSITLPTAFAAGSVFYDSMKFEPSTAGAKYADFFMTFKAQHRVPEGGTVQITVPFDFVDLATAGCVLNFMIASCTAAGHYINFITAQDVTALSLIQVSVNKSFTLPIAQTGLFSILVSYGGTTVDQTASNPTVTSANSFSPLPAAQAMTVTSIDFFPTNQGEPATFTFSFSIPAALPSTSSIVIWFPDDFDPSINTKNSDLECWGNPVEFVGNLLNCKASTFWKVTVSGLMTIPANFQFSVALGGVMNPIMGKIGQFRFAVQDSSGKTVHYQVNSGNFSISKGPNPMKFKILSYANNQLRATNTLTFNFSPATNIPSSDDQGQIFIDLPSEFPLMNIGDQTGWELPCSTWLLVNDVVSATNWNDRVQCINYNSNRIIVTGGKAFTALATQTIRITIDQVPGPQLGAGYRLIKIMTYDGVNKVFLDRNYGQLSYVDSYAFTLMGEELVVNSGAAVNVMRGTCSNPLTIQTKDPLHPMRVNLQLTGLMPRVLTSRLSPTNVLTFKTSSISASFCLAVPVDLTPGTYNMHWSKTGDDYYLDSTGDEIYAPLAVTSVSVSASKATITIGEMSDAAAGGHSLPIAVSVSNSPYNELIVTPTQVGALDTSISFDPPSLQFGPGDKSLSFYIVVNTVINKTDHEIEWQLDGTDAAAYIQPGNSFFHAVGTDETPPIISNARYASTRTTASVYLIASKRGTVFYQVELADTPLPSSSQLRSAHDTGKAQTATLFQPSLELLLAFTGLAADTRYVVYMTLEDTSGRLSPVKALNFTTQSDYQSVKFVIDFAPTASVTRETDIIQQVLAPEVARALSVTAKRVTMYNVAFDAVMGRRLAGAESVDASLYTKNAIVVMLANDKYVDMPSPQDIANALTIDVLNSYFKKHGLTAVSKSSAIVLTNDQPQWDEEGNIWETDGSSITGAGSLLDRGYIHMVIVNAGERAPTAQQVVWGLDGDNKPTRHASAYFDGLADLAYAKYEGLSSDTRYDVYIAATSAYPGNNKAITASAVAYQGVRTTAIYECVDGCPLYYVADYENAVVLLLGGLWM